MRRISISLPDSLSRALEEASVRRDKTISQLIEESLQVYGIKRPKDSPALVQRAREHSGMTEAQATHLAVEETRAARKR